MRRSGGLGGWLGGLLAVALVTGSLGACHRSRARTYKGRYGAEEGDSDDTSGSSSAVTVRAPTVPVEAPKTAAKSALGGQAEATGAAASPAEATAKTLNGDPKGPKQEEFNAVVQGSMPTVQHCFEGAATGDVQMDVRYQVQPDGRTTNVVVNGAPPAIASCVQSAASEMKFPTFQGSAVAGGFPITVKATPPGATP